MAGSDRMMGDWNAEDGHIQQVIGERRTASAWECHAVMYIEKEVPKAAVQRKLLKKSRIEKAMARPSTAFFTLHKSRGGKNAGSTGPFWHGQSYI
jgi:hypothetical protein